MLPSAFNNPTFRSVALGLLTGLVAALPAALFRPWHVGAFTGFVVLALLLGGLLGWCQQLLAPKRDPERDRLTAALRSLASGSAVRLEGDTAEVRDLNALCDRFDRLNRALEGITANALPLVDRIELSVHELSQTEAEPPLALPALGQSIDRVSTKSQALSSSIEEMSMSMEEMLASITEVSSNTNTLSMSVGQTSTGIEEMATSIQHVAANVVEANRVAENASEAALAGQRSVHQTIEGMEQINRVMGDMMAVITHLGQSSNEIGNIVEVIEDIADQTNLLALNAAIEAARAGEVGRGFAVVADEVRKLAERSAKATKEIAGIIKGIQSQIAQATTLTSQGDEAIHTGLSVSQGANSSLEAIVQAVDKVRELIIEIAHAAEEQAQASQIISTAVSSGAVMSMGSLTERMVEASGRQTRGAEQIILAIDTVYSLTQEILTTATEQRSHSEELLQSLSGSESHPAAEALAAYAQELKHLLSELSANAPERPVSGVQSAMVHALSLPAPSGR